MKIGIIGAMDVEVEHLKAELMGAQVERVACTDFCAGRLGEKDVVVVKCGIGKVNAGICAQVLADHFGCTHLINTGVAGSLDAARLDIGDLVVSTDCVQHDFSVGALGYAPGLVPGRERPEYVADAALRDELARSVTDAALVVVGQRIATIMNADEILVLDEGHVVGRGTHDELLRSCPAYLEIAQSQLSAAELGLTDEEIAAVLDGAAGKGGER